jgi:hypothetical protein
MAGKMHGGGVKLEQGMGKISQSQDDVLSGKETKMENDSMGSAKMISGSHSKGKFMATPKYKSDAQRKAAHASMSEGAGKYGKHKGAAQAKPDYIDIDGDGNKTESMKEASDGMGKYGHKKGPKKSGESYDMDKAYDKKMSGKARLHYLENAIHDKKKK